MASAQAVTDPPSITITWTPPQAACEAYSIYRRAFGQRDWIDPPIAVLQGDATSYTDVKLNKGVAYEYRIDRENPDGTGYVCAAIELPLVEERGILLLLVDQRVAMEVQPELQRLRQDLIGDGWRVIRIDVPATATVPQVKDLILAQYRKDPDAVKSVFLFGHIAVPYSGVTPIDGHPNHSGAWAADVFYGTTDFPWTDTEDYPRSYQNGNARRNWNKPGDGKYDQSNLPANSVRLQVGRVDLSRMTTFRQSEGELLRQYLNKDHRFRQGQLLAERRGITKGRNNSGWYNQSALFSSPAATIEDWFASPPRSNYLLMGYASGTGVPTASSEIGETKNFDERDPGLLFTMAFGSWFGDWDQENDFLRAPLCAANTGLTSVYGGVPPVYLHHMGLGLPIGYSIMRTQNNGGGTDYGAGGRRRNGNRDGSVSKALMGDPTLRLFVVPPPTEMQATVAQSVVLQWSAANDPEVCGYAVYRSDALEGPFTQIDSDPAQYDPLYRPDTAGPSGRLYGQSHQTGTHRQRELL